MTDAVRTATQRKTDTITRLEGDADVWIATAGRTIMRDGQWTPA
jgi:hypothetical protein